MVRNGQVKNPSEWNNCGYNEITGERKRYRIINRNLLMEKIDFAKEEFNSLSKDDGLDTDRGKTYILYGEPDKIERTYSDIFNVLEVWIYNSMNEKIYFSDKTGTGKFIRIK